MLYTSWIWLALLATFPALVPAAKQCIVCSSANTQSTGSSGAFQVATVFTAEGVNCSRPSNIGVLAQYKTNCADLRGGTKDGNYYCVVTAYWKGDGNAFQVERSCIGMDIKVANFSTTDLDTNGLSCVNFNAGGDSWYQNRTTCVCKAESCNTGYLAVYNKDNKYDFFTNISGSNSNSGAGSTDADGTQSNNAPAGSSNGGLANSPINSSAEPRIPAVFKTMPLLSVFVVLLL